MRENKIKRQGELQLKWLVRDGAGAGNSEVDEHIWL